jgi:hypothetical protein
MMSDGRIVLSDQKSINALFLGIFISHTNSESSLIHAIIFLSLFIFISSSFREKLKDNLISCRFTASMDITEI